MAGTLVAFLIAAWVLWVYWDATSHKIGKVPDEEGFLNMSAGAWSIVSFSMAGILAYLWKRDRLIALAQIKPIEVKNRPLKFVALVAVCALFVIVGATGAKA